MPSFQKRLDVHTHWVPPFYSEALRSQGHEVPDGLPWIPEWSAEKQLAVMDELSIETSYLSISTPGCHLQPGKDAEARALCRRVNEEGAKLKKQYPGRFGMFASLPLPDVEGALAEIDYALDVCGAEGFCLLTSTHGIYLGDALLDPVFARLNERKAVVFVHPTSPYLCHCPADRAPASSADVSPAWAFDGKYPRPMMDFFFETGRAFVNLLLSNTLKKNPDIKFLVSHMGGSFPVLIDRVCNFASLTNKDAPTPEEMRRSIKEQLWFDLAGANVFHSQHAVLLQHARADHLCYGSDMTFTPSYMVPDMARHIEENADKALEPYGGSLQGVLWDNPARLVGRAE